MCERAYGTPKPGWEYHPTLCMLVPIKFWKKVIFFLIPNDKREQRFFADLHQIVRQPIVWNVAHAEAEEEAGNNNSGDAQR